MGATAELVATAAVPEVAEADREGAGGGGGGERLIALRLPPPPPPPEREAKGLPAALREGRGEGERPPRW